MIAGLWVVSIVGSWFNFVTLVYLCKILNFSTNIHYCRDFLIISLTRFYRVYFGSVFVLLHTVPVFYEKYEDQVDAYAEKAVKELKRQYAIVDEKYLSKIPRGPFKDKKAA